MAERADAGAGRGGIGLSLGVWGRRGLLLGAIVAAALGLWAAYAFAYDEASADERRDARATAQLQVSVLQSELDKQRSVPVILADDSDVVHALEQPSEAASRAISVKLARLQAETRSAALYVIDREGTTRSASNYAQPASFVGSNYAFRRYFMDALRSGQAEQFALGTVSGRPGLYIAHRVEAAGRPVGVVVVKVEFDDIEAAWSRARTQTFVTDATGAVLLTSRPALRFHEGPQGRAGEAMVSLPAPAPGWRLNLVSGPEEALAAARSATVIAGLAMALAAVAAAWLWRRRRLVADRAQAESEYRERLEHNVALRTQELSEINARLSEEIHERQLTERRLNVLQADLVQANKLAQLGQITAGVAHEINQPLATVRLLAENSLKMLGRGKAKPPASVEKNLDDIVRMSDRIGHITGELRTFSRKATGASEPVLLKETLDSSILLNRSRQRHNRVRLVREPIDPQLTVVGGRIRLEQVVVNLLQNAFEALEETPDPTVRISAEAEAEWVWLRITDNGPGLAPQVLSLLFQPFVSTKEKGLGLGLVIAHDILREFGGDLSAANGEAGAVFTLKLRRVRP